MKLNKDEYDNNINFRFIHIKVLIKNMKVNQINIFAR